MKAALLPDRGVVKVAGDDARKFLNGLVTVDLGTVTPKNARFTALLTPQGKIIADFIAVTKADGEWQQLKPAILGAIMEHFMSGAPIVHSEEAAAAAGDDEFFEPKDSDTVATIKELIETRVRPAVANDGGDITFRGFKDGIVYLNMKGACSGCPSSTATLRHGIQNLLRHYLPDVVEVRPM